MKTNWTAFGKKNRAPGRVYMVSLEVEVLAAGEIRPIKPGTYTATEVSLQGFYLLCDDPIDLPHRFNFAVLFPKPSTKENVQLIIGAARIIRREQHFAEERETLGLEARIEQIDRMWEGEEERAS